MAERMDRLSGAVYIVYFWKSLYLVVGSFKMYLYNMSCHYVLIVLLLK